MATLFTRLYFYRLEKIPKGHRQKLGEKVQKAFFSQEEKMKFHQVQQAEGKRTFRVLLYDARFTQKMDEIILEYCKKYDFIPNPREPRKFQPTLTITTPPEPVEYVPREISVKPKRKRKPIHSQPVYSTKNYKR